MRALLLLGVLVTSKPSKSTGSGCPGKLPSRSEEHISWFKKIHKTWPPGRVNHYPGPIPAVNSPGWEKGLLDRQFKLSKAGRGPEIDRTLHWEMYLDLAQMWITKNFTASGWATRTMPADVHKKVKAFLKKSEKAGRSEGKTIHITGDRQMHHLPGDLKQLVFDTIRPMLEVWADQPPNSLRPTSCYGIRKYLEGSTLEGHVDVLNTHVLSAVYVVEDKNLSEPWFMELKPDFAGEDVDLDLREGQVFLYESAKLPHGRPGKLIGKDSSYASVFTHFQPMNWNMVNEDRVYAVNPNVLEASWSGESIERAAEL
jgi:hypothetical protein